MPKDVYLMFQYTTHPTHTNSKQSVHPTKVVLKLLFHKLQTVLMVPTLQSMNNSVTNL